MTSHVLASHEVILEMALRNQVIEEVETSINEFPESCRIVGVQKVMKFLLDSGMHEHVELSVSFANALIRMMLSFVKELILERVQDVSLSEGKVLQSLSERGDGVSAESAGVCKLNELEECDSFLRSLRALQGDMIRLAEINAGAIESDLVISRPASVAGAAFPEGSSVDHVVERSLLTGNFCSGVHWLSLRFGETVAVSETIRSVSRLIAYLFLNSPSMDSFFVGIHILRNSGQHVERVLEAIYLNTSVKAVRDRISRHLAHRGFVSSDQLRALEEVYLNNCYWTELNRRWTARALTSATSYYDFKAIIKSHHPAKIQVECGNIPDIPAELEGHGAGQIGSVSAEESQSVVKCVACLEEKRGLSEIGPALQSKGYLHITVSWIRRMTAREYELVIAEGKGKANLELAVLHKDWRAISGMTQVNAVVKSLNRSSHGKFLDMVISGQVTHEKLREGCENSLSRTELAAIKKLFLLPNKSLSTGPNFHTQMLNWMMSEKSLPQLALLYLRNYALGQSEEEVLSILQYTNNDSLGLKCLLFSRLGNPFLSKIAEDSKFDALTAIAVWMMSGQRPISSMCLAIKQEFPVFERFLIDGDNQPQQSFIDGKRESDERLGNGNDIFEAKAFKGDVSILELLQDVFPDLDFMALASRRAESFVSPSRELAVVSRVEYLLSQGRPCLAFKECHQENVAASSWVLQKAARRVAFYNLFDDGIVASSVSFLDLFGEPTETLRVDVQSARTIVSSVEGSMETIRDLFLSFQSGSNNASLLSGLKLLEESAWAKEPPITDSTVGGAASNASPPAGGGFESPWHLVALFCRVHNLPRSLTLLHELARNGDWVMFLHESDLQQCPLETVRDVIQSYFGQNPLRSHLNILLGIPPSLSEALEASASGLAPLVNGDSDDWLDIQSSSSIVLRERKNSIFENRSDPALLFIKYFRLFRFRQASVYFSQVPEESVEETVETASKNIPQNGILRKEFRSIVDLEYERTNTLRSLVSPRSDLAVDTEGEDTDCSNAKNYESVNIDEIREIVNQKKWNRPSNLVVASCLDSISALIHVLVDEFDEGDHWNEFDYDGLVGIICFEKLELFGDLVLQRTRSQPVPVLSQKHHFDFIVYSAYSAGFVSPHKFQAFLDSLGNLPIHQLIRSSDPHSREAFQAQIALADQLMSRTLCNTINQSDNLLNLGGAVRISKLYHSLGQIGKHITANRFAESIARSIRGSEVLG